MKHIYSIRSIYFKRFTLAALLGVVSISAWASSTNHGKLTAETELNSDSNGAGKIYVSTTALPEGTEPTVLENTQEVNCSATVVKIWTTLYQGTSTFYCYARETKDTEGLWAGWYDNSGALQGGGEKDIEYTVTPAGTEQKPTEFYLTAKWVKPQVTSSATLDLGTITDKTADVAAQTVTLNIADYSKTEHFKAEPSTVNGFSTTLLSTTEPNENWEGTASVEVDYTPSGKHGEHKATAYLASSLYGGDYPNHQYKNDWQPINLKIYENYTPDYEVVHNSFADAYNMGVTNVGGQLTSLEGALKVQDGTKNYAAQQPHYTGIGDNRNTTEWQATIVPCEGYEGYAQYFTIQPGTANTETPVVVFNAGFEVPENTSDTVYACLNLQCTYHDESSPAKNLTHTQLIYLSATVEQTNEAVLNIITDGDVDKYEFPDTYIGATPTKAFALYAANIENLQITQAGDALFAGEIVGSNIRISLNEKVSGQYPSCGTYTATFTVSGVSQLDHTTFHEDQIRVTVELLLAPPTLSALGGNQVVTFQWDPVPGATKYIVSSDANGKQNKTETTECVYAVSVNNTISVTCYVHAMNDDGCESEVVSATATANLNTITIDNAANTGLFTGTAEHQGDNSFPWRDPRPVDLSAAFDQAGNALFDTLYIFALTEGDQANSLTTPCLIYKKNTATSYTKSRTDIINNSTKSSALKIDLQTQGQSQRNKKLYFTGYCPYGATGGTEDNGVVNLIGGAQTVDIYLDSLQLYAREKKGGTDGTIKITADTKLTNGAYIAQGSGGVFVIESTSTDASHPFNVNIHARGNNTLASQNGSKIEVNVEKTYMTQKISIQDSPKHYSAPIEVLPTSAYSATNLTIDDLWPNEERHTKGVLVLKEFASDQANISNISIGLGNALTQLQLAGAQLYMRDVAYHTTTYTASKNDVSVSILAYGVTSENTKYSPKRNANNQIALTDGTYNSLSSDPLKLYTKRLTIDGGTYNADIQHFTDDKITEQKSFYNADGKELYKVTVDNATQYGDTANGKYTVTKFAEMVDAFFPHAGVNYQMANSPAPYHAPLSAYYVGTKTYGHSSWAPKKAPKNNLQLTLWLPKIDCNAVKIPWQICAPSFVAQVSGENMPLGGKIQKIDGCPMPEHTNPYTVDYLLYMQMDDYTKEALQYYSLKQSNAIEVKIALEDSAMYNTIDNESEYTIQKKVYMLMPIEAAKWTLITPPFDVANVYIIESYPEAQLIKDFKGKRGRIPTEYIAAARRAQAQRLMDLYTFWYYEEKGIGEASDFFGTGDGYTNGYGRFVNSWMEYEKNTNWKLDSTGNYTPVVEKLIHFTGKNGTYPDGKNWLYANYYLYKSTNEWNYQEGKFTTQWDTVTTPLGGSDPIMSKGQTYAMHFPFNSLNGKHDPDQTWDYWTGKYILVESTPGTPEQPHDISGKANAVNLIEGLPLRSETAVLQGNASFAEITPSTSYAIWALEQRETSLSPAQGALISNFTEPVGLRAIGVHYETGRVIYDSIPQEEPEQEIPTSIPTIMDGLSLVVETIDGGLRITPAQPQHVLLYNAAGQLILNQYLTSTKEVLLPAGVYIIPTGTQPPKRVVVF